MARFKSITLEWREDRVIFIDQRKLPIEEVYVECKTHEEVYGAIKDMVVRGAPAIGASAASVTCWELWNSKRNLKNSPHT